MNELLVVAWAATALLVYSADRAVSWVVAWASAAGIDPKIYDPKEM